MEAPIDGYISIECWRLTMQKCPVNRTTLSDVWRRAKNRDHDRNKTNLGTGHADGLWMYGKHFTYTSYPLWYRWIAIECIGSRRCADLLMLTFESLYVSRCECRGNYGNSQFRNIPQLCDFVRFLSPSLALPVDSWRMRVKVEASFKIACWNGQCSVRVKSSRGGRYVDTGGIISSTKND